MLNFLKTIAKKSETFLYYTSESTSLFGKYDSLEDLDQIKIRHEDTLMELEKIGLQNKTYYPTPLCLLF